MISPFLTGLTEGERSDALTRFQAIRPFIEDGVALLTYTENAPRESSQRTDLCPEC